MTSPVLARAYILLVILSGLGLSSYAIMHWRCDDLDSFITLLVAAGGMSLMKIKLPGIAGSMSLNFVLMLVGIAELDVSETIVVGCAAVLIQRFWHCKRRPNPTQVLFNLAVVVLAVSGADWIYHWPVIRSQTAGPFLSWTAAASAYFALNTFPVSAVIALTEGKPLRSMFHQCYFWMLPYYLMGAVAAASCASGAGFRWKTAVCVAPIVYMVFSTYRNYIERLEGEKDAAQATAGLHRRTMEAIALAIDSRDRTTYEHFQRGLIYSVSLGQELGLDKQEIEALRTAALLHDIGMLAMPDAIVQKTGDLTRREFECYRMHPAISAEMIEDVQFPYPVLPIILSHHERWDGTGFPEGLSGERIPIGARILAPVNYINELLSWSHQGRALTIDRAVHAMAEQAGTSFDPAIVESLAGHYADWEQEVQAAVANRRAESRKHNNPEQVAAGASSVEDWTFVDSIANARLEHRFVTQTSDDGQALDLRERFSIFALRLNRWLPFECMTIYLRRGNKLVPEFCYGAGAQLFASREIEVGEGLCGWVAERHRCVFNGNPAHDLDTQARAQNSGKLASAIVVPLESFDGTEGVLAIYRAHRGAFTKEELRQVLSLRLKILDWEPTGAMAA